MTEDELIELMAKVSEHGWDDLREIERQYARIDMRRALAALSEAEFAIVPVEPTEAMLRAWSRATYPDPYSVDHTDATCAKSDWSAMLAASPFATDKE